MLKSSSWKVNGHFIVIPSISFSKKELETVPGALFFEERMLYLIYGLEDGKTEIIYLTSIPIDPAIIEYYFNKVPSAPRSNIKFFSMNDGSPRPLAEKLYNDSIMMKRLSKLAEKDEVIMATMGGDFESKIAQKLGLPISNATKSQQYWGTKAGSREIFHECGIPHPDGTFTVLKSRKDLVAVIKQVCSRNLNSKKGVVKLMEGFAGRGNAVITLRDITSAISSDQDDVDGIIEKALLEMKFVCPNHDWLSFQAAVEDMGAIFELWVECPKSSTLSSPSVQVLIGDFQKVTILSTHEQILDEQIYVGCDFPANPIYSNQIIEYGRRVGEFLAIRGIQDHFSIDFVCFHDRNAATIQAIEVNLRITGTTAPFMTLHLLSKGEFDVETGNYIMNNKSNRYYRSSDHIHNPIFKRFLPCNLLELSKSSEELRWDGEQCIGVIMHMMGQISHYGGLGLTAIGKSKDHAKILFENALSKLEEAARNI